VRIVLQRVRSAAVSVDGAEVASIGRGLLALVGVEAGDEAETAERMARKTAALRLFPSDGPEVRPFDRSIGEVGGALLSVSQFTLLGDVRRGNRPSWSGAAPGTEAAAICSAYAAALRRAGLEVEEGVFGADMQVHLVNDGPVTLVIDSADLGRSRSGR
jgi:D-tyrosyl-tRNA(Tyr) deacylase